MLLTNLSLIEFNKAFNDEIPAAIELYRELAGNVCIDKSDLIEAVILRLEASGHILRVRSGQIEISAINQQLLLQENEKVMR